MILKFRIPLRHPFHAEWVTTPARQADGTCTVLTGSVAELRRAAAEGARALRAIFVLQYPDRPFLSAAEREELWQSFQVPIFGLLLDRQGRLTAWECEAQDGFHVGGAWTEHALWVARLFAGGWSLHDNQCECGRSGERLRRTPADAIPRRGPQREEHRVPAAVLQEA
jgi:hypothetical protein